MRWIFLVLVFLVSGCPPRPCDSSNCDGCCASDTECVSGTARLECGLGGEVCVRCTNQERCAMAKCEALPIGDAGVSDAGPVVCSCRTSCCAPDGTCAPNNDIDACGPVREFCGTCMANQRCSQGTCVAAACNGCLDPLGACRPGTEAGACGVQGGVCFACGTDQACQNGACAFTRCDMNNCRFGCCRLDNACLTPSVAACGLGGDPCRTCGAAEQCLAGSCR